MSGGCTNSTDETTQRARAVIRADVEGSSGTYTYDGAGNVASIGSNSYLYDPVSRLVSATQYTGTTPGTGSAKTQTAAYDLFGNLTNLTTAGAGLSLPTSASTNRLTSATFDTAGSMTSWNGNTYAYEPAGMTKRVYASAVEYDHIYTADDERIWTFQPGAPSRFTVRDLDGSVLREFELSGATWTVEKDYVYRDGVALASVQTTGEVHHLHPDHLGSPRLITRNGGAYVSYHVYHPYGAEATAFNQDTERKKFTGHERDLGMTNSAADDLDYVHARFYNPLSGRFLQADRNKGLLKSPRSLNRYAYGLGNPLRFADPDGFKIVEPTDKRTRLAIAKMATTAAGRAAYEALDRAEGTYTIIRRDTRLTPVDKRRLLQGRQVTKEGGHFTPKHKIENDKVRMVSGGTIVFDFGIIDRAAEPPYNGADADAALAGHEFGHAVHYELDRADFLENSGDYHYLETRADELQGNVLDQLKKKRISIYGVVDPFAGNGFCAAEHASC